MVKLPDLFSDLPVVGAAGLAFEFDGLAKTLADLAQNPKNQTPFTVVVRGGWGRGKTTLLRQTKRRLDAARAAGNADERRVFTLWFNAWKYPHQDTVLAGLLGALLDELRTGDLLDQLKLAVDERKDQVGKAILRTAAPWLFERLGEEGRYSDAEAKRATWARETPRCQSKRWWRGTGSTKPCPPRCGRRYGP